MSLIVHRRTGFNGSGKIRQEMNSNFRHNFWWRIGLPLLGVFALLGIAGWLASDITAQTDRIVQDRLLIRERSASLNKLAELKRLAPQALVYEQKLSAFLPTQEQLLDFPRMLDSLARVHQLALNFTFQGGQGAPQGSVPGYVGFSLDVQGTFNDIVGFLKNVEFEPPRFLATLDSFDVVKNGGSYRLLAQGRVFFR